METLPITSSSGAQSSTDSPQTASPVGLDAQQSSSLQPVTAISSLETGQAGIPLGGIDPASRTVAPGATQAVTSTASVHAFSPLLIGFSLLCIIVAVALFWYTIRSVKNTTY